MHYGLFLLWIPLWSVLNLLPDAWIPTLYTCLFKVTAALELIPACTGREVKKEKNYRSNTNILSSLSVSTSPESYTSFDCESLKEAEATRWEYTSRQQKGPRSWFTPEQEVYSSNKKSLWVQLLCNWSKSWTSQKLSSMNQTKMAAVNLLIISINCFYSFPEPQAT